jgi:hypothetical protein
LFPVNSSAPATATRMKPSAKAVPTNVC